MRKILITTLLFDKLANWRAGNWSKSSQIVPIAFTPERKQNFIVLVHPTCIQITTSKCIIKPKPKSSRKQRHHLRNNNTTHTTHTTTQHNTTHHNTPQQQQQQTFAPVFVEWRKKCFDNSPVTRQCTDWVKNFLTRSQRNVHNVNCIAKRFIDENNVFFNLLLGSPI
jgi:hypothetical protein